MCQNRPIKEILGCQKRPNKESLSLSLSLLLSLSLSIIVLFDEKETNSIETNSKETNNHKETTNLTCDRSVQFKV